MITARDAALALADVHLLLNTVRPKPAQVVRLPGATVFVRPGEDAAYPSSAANRVFRYGVGAAPLGETLRAAAAEYRKHGVQHWFPHIGPGADAAEVRTVMAELGARVWPHVRYPVLARDASKDVADVKTTLEIRRVNAAEIRSHLQDLEAVSDRPEGAHTFLRAAAHPDFGHVLGFDRLDSGERRAVATGMLATSGPAGYLCFGVTHAGFRKRGGQSAIIAERVRMARDRGCTVCLSETLTILETSLNNLVRIGFRPVFEWTVLEVGTPIT